MAENTTFTTNISNSNTMTSGGSNRRKSKPCLTVTNVVTLTVLILVMLALIGGAAYLLVKALSKADPKPKRSDGLVTCYAKTPSETSNSECSGKCCQKILFDDGRIYRSCINGSDPEQNCDGNTHQRIENGDVYYCDTNRCNSSTSIVSGPSLIMLMIATVGALFRPIF